MHDYDKAKPIFFFLQLYIDILIAYSVATMY